MFDLCVSDASYFENFFFSFVVRRRYDSTELTACILRDSFASTILPCFILKLLAMNLMVLFFSPSLASRISSNVVL